MVAEFAREMTMGAGAHRDHRSGGSARRNRAEIFHDTFNGKLSEVAVWEVLKEFASFRTVLSEVDFSVMGLGSWDVGDLRIGKYVLQVKSTKSFGNLLLLEKADWNSNAEYLPGEPEKALATDAIILARLKPALWEVCNYRQIEGNFSELFDQIMSARWEVNIAGFATKADIKTAISSDQLIPKNALLQNSTYMDADNYYIQAGDLWDISLLDKYLRSLDRLESPGLSQD